MCGILGVAQFKKRIVAQEEFEKTLEMLSHRGPDSFGVFAGKEIFLGNRRLSIIDLSPSGNQPMRLSCKKTKKRLQLVFNGEIYNFKELRVILEQLGHIFKTNSDTEVILHGFEQWGTVSFEKLRGMFALALWDEEQKKLFLARDRFGIKPLYYLKNKDYFAFASEIRALKKIVGSTVPIREGAVYEFLQQGYISQPKTFYRDIEMLEAGSFMEVSAGGVRAESFFDIISYYRQEQSPLSFEEAVGQLQNVLQDSTRHHMLSDVPIGLFLSGGIDSSSLLVSLREQGFENLLTVSAVFPGTVYDESNNIHSLVNALGTNHCDVPISGQDFLIFLDRIFEYMDQPTSDGVNTFFVSLAAKQAGLKVVLSGLGGDEIFYGYPSFRDIPRLRLALPYLRVFQTAGGFSLWRKLDSFNRRASKLEQIANSNNLNQMWNSYRALFTKQQIKVLAHGIVGVADNNISEAIFDENERSLCQSVSYYEFSRYMRNQLLRDSDVFSMAHSIELRVPFVDDFVMRFAASLPDSYKISSGQTKRILREMIRPRVPSRILQSPKKGFVLPIEQWLKSEAREVIWDELKSSHLLNQETVQKMLELFEQNKLHWSRIWSLFVLERFLRKS